MPRYAAFLRGVMATNAKMPALKRAFEEAGFDEVRTVLGSGNVVFESRAANETTLQRRVVLAMQEHLGRTFMTFIRPVEALQALIAADPFAPYHLPEGSKRIVTFLRVEPPRTQARLPEQDGARILVVRGREVFSAYVPSQRGPVFMSLIERTFGTDLTTRTWETVKKVAR